MWQGRKATDNIYYIHNFTACQVFWMESQDEQNEGPKAIVLVLELSRLSNLPGFGLRPGN